MSNVIHFNPARKQRIQFEQRMEEATRMSVELTHGAGVVVNNIVYTMDNVMTYLLTDQENREELVCLLTSLLTAIGDDEATSVSRLNRFLISGARELAFQLAGDALKESQGKEA